MLTFISHVKESFGVASSFDKRRKVNKLLVAYKDEEGHEYRKSFEFPKHMCYDEMRAQIPMKLER